MTPPQGPTQGPPEVASVANPGGTAKDGPSSRLQPMLESLYPGSSPEPVLPRIASPADLKRLPLDQLPQVCAEIREFLLQSVQKTGGHLGSNLGVVELSTALHYVFDLDRDR